MEKIIFHIDVNNAFLSWTAVSLLEKGYKYDIRNSYAAIGGDASKRHGIILAKSTPAKKLGVTTGDPLFKAKNKCPALRIYPPDYNYYVKKSTELFSLLSKYTNDIECFSIDECFLDYTKIKHIHGDEFDFANKIKEEINNKLGFTVNIGIANNKLCAKMASDFLKPNRVHTLYNYEIKTKMFPLPIEDLFGIGKKTAPKLRNLGINSIGDLANYKSDDLYKYFKNQALKMVGIANGIDNSLVNPIREDNKGISNSTTLKNDVTNKLEAYKVLESLSDNIGISLRKQKKYASVIAVNIKNSYFKNTSHQRKLLNSTNSTSEIFKIAKDLLDEMWNLEPIRLIGIRVDHLTEVNNYQVSIFDKFETKEKDTKLEKVVDNLKEKYGLNILKNASLNDKEVSKKYMK